LVTGWNGADPKAAFARGVAPILRPAVRRDPSLAGRMVGFAIAGEQSAISHDDGKLEQTFRCDQFGVLGIFRCSGARLAGGGMGAVGPIEYDKRFFDAALYRRNQGYHNAPMSVLLLDEQRPLFTFSKTLNTFSKRHHLRIWLRSEKWRGAQVLTASATQDIGCSLQEKQDIHSSDRYRNRS
jgi:LssY C-terminus